MPKDIASRRTKFFGNGYQLSTIFDKFEERQIFFEDKKNKLMLRPLFQECARESEDVLGNASLAALND